MPRGLRPHPKRSFCCEMLPMRCQRLQTLRRLTSGQPRSSCPSGVLAQTCLRFLAPPTLCWRPLNGGTRRAQCWLRQYRSMVHQASRTRAHRLYRRLVDGGVVVPEWVEALGDVTPDRALLISDEWDDEYFVWIDFLCPDGGVRWLGVDVDRLWTGWARGFVHGPMGEEMLNRISDSPPGTLREISLSDSRAIIEAGLRELGCHLAIRRR